MRTFTLYLVRHGLTAGNILGQYIGKTDLPLAKQGIDTLTAYKNSGLYPAVGRVYCGGLKRCTESAAIIYPERTPVLVPELNECDFGEYEGRTPDEIKHRADYAEWLKGGYDARPPGGESYGEFSLRCIAGLERIVLDMFAGEYDSAALITHAGVIMSLLAGYGLPKARPGAYALNQGEGFGISLTAFLWSHGPAFEVLGKLTNN